MPEAPGSPDNTNFDDFLGDLLKEVEGLQSNAGLAPPARPTAEVVTVPGSEAPSAPSASQAPDALEGDAPDSGDVGLPDITLDRDASVTTGNWAPAEVRPPDPLADNFLANFIRQCRANGITIWSEGAFGVAQPEWYGDLVQIFKSNNVDLCAAAAFALRPMALLAGGEAPTLTRDQIFNLYTLALASPSMEAHIQAAETLYALVRLRQQDAPQIVGDFLLRDALTPKEIEAAFVSLNTLARELEAIDKP